MADTPLAICIMASVMMKEGMPMKVMPKAVTRPKASADASARMMAIQPGSGMLAMFT